MSSTVAGFVRNGVIVPNAPLPDGTFVEVHVISKPIDVPPELQAELAAWQQAGAEGLELVERAAQVDHALMNRFDSSRIPRLSSEHG